MIRPAYGGGGGSMGIQDETTGGDFPAGREKLPEGEKEDRPAGDD